MFNSILTLIGILRRPLGKRTHGIYSLVIYTVFFSAIGIGLIFGVSEIGQNLFKIPNSDSKEKEMVSNESTLEERSVGWSYRQLLQKPELFQNEIIQISGKVIDYTTIDNRIPIQTGCSNVLEYYECDIIFLQTPTSYIVGDEISGFVSVNGFHEFIVKVPETGALVGEKVPIVEPIEISCDRCSGK